MSISIPTLKALFALSCNVCAYSPCDEHLTDPSWPSVMADIAHIRGRRPGSARYDPSMSDDERDAFENLLLLCPNHHRIVDLLEPDRHSVAELLKMKSDHDGHCRHVEWAPEPELTRVAHLLLLVAAEAGPTNTVLDVEGTTHGMTSDNVELTSGDAATKPEVRSGTSARQNTREAAKAISILTESIQNLQALLENVPAPGASPSSEHVSRVDRMVSLQKAALKWWPEKRAALTASASVGEPWSAESIKGREAIAQAVIEDLRREFRLDASTGQGPI